MRARRSPAVLVLVLTGLVACGAPSIDSNADMIEALARAGITCDEWDSNRGRGDQHDTNLCYEPSDEFIAFRRAATEQDAKLGIAVGQETTRCVYRQWSQSANDPTAPGPFDYLLLGTWSVWGASESIEAVQDEIGGQVYTKDDPAPGGVSEADYRLYADTDECSPTLPVPPAPDPTPTVPQTEDPVTEAPASGDEPCVEDCVWSVNDVVSDLDGILCKSQDQRAALQGDVTDGDRLRTAADKILVCENGGSNSLSGYGIVYIWRDFDDMGQGLATLSLCNEPGITAPPAVTVHGGNVGNPGYAVANVQSGEQVVSWLVQGGAEVLCEG